MGPGHRAWSARAVVAALTVSLGAAGLAACDSGDSTEPAVETRSWHPIALAPDVVPTVLTTAGSDELVVGGQAKSRPVPRLYLLGTSQETRPIGLATTSFYAPLAIWRGVATEKGAAYALGGARGGAHGNVRWTVYQGTLRGGLTEDEQGFEIFGGPSAGGLVGIAMAGDRPVIAGSWASPGPGLDIATWELDGHDWVRQDSAGTSLASSPQAQLSVRGITSAGPGLVLAGAVTELGGGKVTMHPAVWSSPTGSAPWQRLELPASGIVTEAQSVTCADNTCLVAGQADRVLRLWQVQLGVGGVTGVEEVEGLPRVVLPELSTVVAPVRLGDGRWAVVVPDGDGSRLLVGAGDDWTQVAGPEGDPVSVGFMEDGSDRVYVGSRTEASGGLNWTDLGS